MININIIDVFRDFGIAFVVGACWAILFGAPKQILWLVGLLGGMGHSVRYVLIELDFGLISSTLTGAVLVGLVGVYAARTFENPPVVFTMPACITMIPGLYAYKTMIAGIKIADPLLAQNNPKLIMDMAHNMTLTISLLFTLAIGISIGALLFRMTNAKDTPIKDMMKRD